MEPNTKWSSLKAFISCSLHFNEGATLSRLCGVMLEIEASEERRDVVGLSCTVSNTETLGCTDEECNGPVDFVVENGLPNKTGFEDEDEAEAEALDVKGPELNVLKLK